jgi:acetylglutamate synthase
MEVIALYILRFTLFEHLLRPIVFKIQQISDTENQAIQTKGVAYNSVHVYLLITTVSLTTCTGLPRITLCKH